MEMICILYAFHNISIIFPSKLSKLKKDDLLKTGHLHHLKYVLLHQ